MRIGGIRERRLVLSFERRRVVERCSDDSPDKLGLGVQLASRPTYTGIYLRHTEPNARAAYV